MCVACLRTAEDIACVELFSGVGSIAKGFRVLVCNYSLESWLRILDFTAVSLQNGTASSMCLFS